MADDDREDRPIDPDEIEKKAAPGEDPNRCPRCKRRLPDHEDWCPFKP